MCKDRDSLPTSQKSVFIFSSICTYLKWVWCSWCNCVNALCGVTRAVAGRSEESSRSVTASVIIIDIITEFHQQPFSWNAGITVCQCSLDWILTGKQ